MDTLFSNIPNVCVYFDDLFVTGADDNEHLKTLETVLEICEKHGLSIRKEKCEFMKYSVTFLGYKLSKNGLSPLEEKVRAIKDAPKPKNTNELKSFLGLVNYYAKWVNNMSNMLAPLYKLLSKNTQWHWGKEQNSAFENCKNAISSDKNLVHYDPSKKIILTCDASPYGVGAVLSHIDGDQERPIAFASRSLNKAERNYSQLDREALSIIFGIRKFHTYIYGHHDVTVYTGHKPLLGLFGEHKAMPDHVSARMQRWILILAGYNYNLQYKPGSQNNADALSRLPLNEEPLPYVPNEIEDLFNFIDKLPLSVGDIAKETKNDPILKQVYNHTLHGWPDRVNENLKPFKARQCEISVENECLLLGVRVIVPKPLQKHVLDLLHDTHIGIARMKSQAREWVWWPNIDKDIETAVKSCYQCEVHAKMPTKAPLHPWEWPSEPWQRLHLDFCGPFMGKMYLIVIDAHSKWIDVKIMTKIDASHTIMELREIFSVMGLCKTCVTDNGPTFTSHEFKAFMSANGVEHITVSPYCPSSNGLAERAVQIFKQSMIKIAHGSIREKVCRFLTKYRNTPHSTTGVSPAELIFLRKTRTHLDLLHPCIQTRVINQQDKQKKQHDKVSKDREIGLNKSVFVRNYNSSEKWIPGIAREKTGPLSYRVETPSHGIVRRHQDQIRVTSCDLSRPHPHLHNDTPTQICTPETVGTNAAPSPTCLFDPGTCINQNRGGGEEEEINGKNNASIENTCKSSPLITPANETNVRVSPMNSPTPLRRSTRITRAKPPKRLTYP